MCRIMPLLLLSSQFMLVDLSCDGVFTATWAFETEALGQTIHVSVDHFVGCEVSGVFPMWVGSISGCLTNHGAFF
jgi:polyisoprenoid-binding protein YceI